MLICLAAGLLLGLGIGIAVGLHVSNRVHEHEVCATRMECYAHAMAAMEEWNPWNHPKGSDLQIVERCLWGQRIAVQQLWARAQLELDDLDGRAL